MKIYENDVSLSAGEPMQHGLLREPGAGHCGPGTEPGPAPSSASAAASIPNNWPPLTMADVTGPPPGGWTPAPAGLEQQPHVAPGTPPEAFGYWAEV